MKRLRFRTSDTMTSMELSGESGDGQTTTESHQAECIEGTDSSVGQSVRSGNNTTSTVHTYKDNQTRMASRHLHSTRSQIQRNSAKLKVLGRSHAMREETSPPREPSPSGSPTPSPCISIITSPPPLSPIEKENVYIPVENTAQPEESSIKLNGSPSRVKINVSDSELNEEYSCQNFDKTSDNNDKKIQQSSPKQTSKSLLLVNNNNKKLTEDRHLLLSSNNCDCLSQICSKCSKSFERNVNNNLRDTFNNNNNNNNNNNVIVSGNTSTLTSANTLTVKSASARHKLRHQSSSQGSIEGSSSNSPSLSRDSSTEQYKDCTGIDLQQFIIDTLNKNIKDRMLMLKIEQELINLAKDKIKTHFKFPQMSSYQRMLVHRCAAYFGMDHNIETSGKCVVVNKTKCTRIPETRFKEHIREDLLFPEEPKKSILKRDSNSFEECSGYKSPDRSICLDRKSKSFEEREEEYEKARRRIFKDGTLQHCDSQEEFSWAEMPWPETEPSKIRLMPSESTRNRLLKVQSVETKSDLLRPCVAKSYSFGGYGGSVSVLSRGDSVMSTQSAGPRLLTKQDSSTSTISWRLSPSSSGYKSQSQRSDSVTPSPTATPHQLSDMSGKNSIEDANHPVLEDSAFEGKKEGQLIWAVTSMESVPKGSVLINPQTGQPFTNPDGTIYHFDPSNPPSGISLPPPSPTKQPSSPQKSPMKDTATSPKKTSHHKSRASPAKQRSLTSSSTSPSLPSTSENASNLPIQYGNPAQLSQGVGFTNIATPIGQEGVYNAQVGVVYQSYVPGQQYESRPDSAVTQEISPYFTTMTIQDPAQTYPPPNYWPQQPLYYSPTSPPQRYPLPMTAPQYSIPTTPYPSSYPAVNTEMVPVYNPVQPVQLIYGQTGIPPQQMYMQNPMVYTGGTVAYGQTSGQYPQAGTPNSSYGQYPQAYQEKRSQTQKNSKNYSQRNQTAIHYPPSSNQSSGGSNSPANTVISGYYPPGTGTPMLQGAILPHTAYRGQQCTPPETPPNHTMTQSFSYPPMGYPAQQPMLIRQMSGVTASPPISIGVRSSRSPTPAPEYPDPRTQGMYNRYAPVPQQIVQPPPPPPPQPMPLYGISQPPMPCPVLTGNIGMLPNRSQSQSSMYKQQTHQQHQQPSIYRQPHQQMQQTQYQPIMSHQPVHMEQVNMQRTKPKKQRSKVPSLPPSGKPSLQSIPSHSRY